MTKHESPERGKPNIHHGQNNIGYKPYKASEGDGIIPSHLIHGKVNLIEALGRIVRASTVVGYIPKLWRETKVSFIPA